MAELPREPDTVADEQRKRHLIQAARHNAEAAAAAEETATHRASDPTPNSGKIQIRCPSCHTPVEVAVDTSFTDLTCDACGSHFSLVDQEQATRMAPSLSKLGRFELIERIGVGGFGSVWKARDKELDRTVAIKVPRQGGMTAEEQEKFLREARAAAQLKHPNIVSVHEVGRDGDSIFIVSDFVRGVTLGDWLTGQKLTSREAAALTAKIADALHHAHEQGVVHRDLKPANIMIDGDGQPHLMDFGLARREVGEVTMTFDGHVLGTPAYMSPEQAVGASHRADRRSDVYSLGVVLFQLLTGELPFRGNARMLVHQVINDEPPSPRKFNAAIPKDLETITLKCLEKDPGRRYQSARELGEELQRYLKGETIRARPVGRVERGWRWVKRKPVVAGLLVSLITVTVFGLIALSFLWLRTLHALENEERARVDAVKQRVEAEGRKQAALIAEQVAQDRTWEARRQSYIATVNMANLAAERGNYDEADSLLKSQIPKGNEHDLRGFEWWYVLKKSRPARRTRQRPNITYGLALSKNGQLLASTGKEHLSVNKLGDDAIVGSFMGHVADVYDAAFLNEDKWVASTGADGTLKIWDIESGELIHDVQAHEGPAFSIDVTFDGRLATGGVDKSIRIWDPRSLQLVHELKGHNSLVHSVRFFDEGRRLISGGFDGTIKVWDAIEGKELKSVSVEIKEIWAIAVAPGQREAVIVGGLGKDRYENATLRQPIYLFKLPNLDFSRRISGHFQDALCVAYSPDGNSIATGGRDGSVRLWDAKTGEEQAVYAGTNLVRSVLFTPDNKRVLAGSSQSILSDWDIASTQAYTRIPAHQDHITNVDFSPDGRLLASVGANNSIKIWDAEKYALIREFSGVGGKVDFSPDGAVIALASRDGTVRLLNVEDGKEVAKRDLEVGVLFTLAWSPNGRELAVGTSNNGLFVLDHTLSDIPLAGDRLGNRQVLDVAFSPKDATLFCATYERTLRVWNTKTWTHIGDFAGAGQPIWKVDVSPDGKQVYTVGRPIEGTLRSELLIWDATSRKVIGRLEGHTSEVGNLAISQDGHSLATAATDSMVKLWNLDTSDQIFTFRGNSAPVSGLAFSPNGTALVSGGVDGALHIWTAATNEPERQHFTSQNVLTERVEPSITELRTLVGTNQTVEFRIRAMGGNDHRYLNSRSDYLHQDCFTVVVEPEALTEFDSQIKILTQGLIGTYVRVTGIVEQHDGRIQIRVTNVGRQLEIVDLRDGDGTNAL